MAKTYYPKQLYIEDSVRDEALTKNVLKNLPHLDPKYFQKDAKDYFSDLSIKDGKEVLVVARHKGRFLKSCPGSKDSLCCGYFILESASNCNYDCTYCVLQTYLNTPPIIVYANVEDMFDELTGTFGSQPKTQFRIGTGELTDSLSLDHITEFSKAVIPFFAETNRASIELKTKSHQIENLKNINHRGRSIISWSLNTLPVARKEELKAATIEERIEAARQCQEWGYPVSFHLEPLLYYDTWEKDYHELIDLIFKHIDPERITWISLGGLRLMNGLKDFAEDRFPKSSYLYDELIPGTDGKLRYLKMIRLKLYQKISGWIRQYGQVPMYLCMESSDVWRNGLGVEFPDADEADEFLGRRVFPS